MALVFYSHSDEGGLFEKRFRAAIAEQLPELEVRTWPEIGDASEVIYAALWLPPEGLFKALPNLTHIFALSAGVDRLLQARDLPAEVPIYRLEEGGMAAPMSQYVHYGVLHAQRQMGLYKEAQQRQHWKRDAAEPAAGDWEVGILGAGVLASAVAETLTVAGYPVRTWSRSRKQQPGVTSFAGWNELPAFCENLNTLVCLLPLTSDTDSIMNAELFNRLPKGTSLINVARGEHCVDEDLITALDSGQISSALLDVFRQEPLPSDHPFWLHERIMMTPHIAAPTAGGIAAKQIAKGVADAAAGLQPAGFVDRKTGY